ncbi:MAG: DUF106 domain-containing protein [Thermoplasmata archaeon]|nr:MAG: DUF106 domain-containing protein [Thermoplasmata archaeon]
MAEEEKPAGGSSSMMLMMVMLLMMLFLFDEDIRRGLGQAMDPALSPILSLDYSFPLITLFFASLLSMTLSTLLRTYTTDWMELARVQKIQADFNKEMKDARLSNNQAKVNKLMEKQPEIMRESMMASTQPMKVMPVTMIFVIPIFVWLSFFISRLPVSTVSVPWAEKVALTGFNVCFFPNWIIMYSLMSIPFSQVLYRSLKLFRFREKIAALPKEEGHEI